MYYVSNDYLAHIGNENSGRYPKGSGDYPRAMRKGGPLHAMWLRRNKKEKKAPEVEKLRKPTEKQLMEIINSGDAQKVYKYRRYMSTNDLYDAKSRINAEDDMRQLAEKQIESGLAKFDRYADKWDRATKDIEKFGQGYNRVAKVYNMFADDRAKLPTFETPSSALMKSTGDNGSAKNAKKAKKILNEQESSTTKKTKTYVGKINVNKKKDEQKDNEEARNEQESSTTKKTKTYVGKINVNKKKKKDKNNG